MHDDVDHILFIFNLHTKILSLYLQNTHTIIWAQPLALKVKGKTHLLGRLMSCSLWWIPIHCGPLPGDNCPPLTIQSPLTPSHTFGPYYVTMTTSTISVFLVGNSSSPNTYLSLHITLSQSQTHAAVPWKEQFHQIRFAQKWHSFRALVGTCEAELQKLGVEVF